MIQLKITTIGDSAGIVLSKELLAKLRVAKGDTLYAVETPNGIEFMACNPEFVSQMEVAEEIMHKDRGVLKKLSK